MKTIGFVGAQIRRALHEQRGYVSAEELTDAIYQASNTVFGHYRGHPALYRPGQPLPPRAYQITDVIDVALHPFLVEVAYDRNPQGQASGALPLTDDGIMLFPVAKDDAGRPMLAGSFQHPTALRIDGARRVTQVNDNAVAAREANSLTAPTLTNPIRSSVPGGYRIRPAAITSLSLQCLVAPPQCVFAEKPADDEGYDFVYDDEASVELGWTSVTAINEIIAHATRILGGQVGDGQAVQLANQTNQIGA